MSRTLTEAFIAELEKQSKQLIVFFEGEFANGTARFWSGIGNLSWNSQTWTGVGVLGSVSPIEETSNIRASGVTIGLSGMNAAIMSGILSECRTGKSGKIWIGFMNDNGGVIADPAIAFSGFLDVPGINDAGESCQITISYENKLRDLERAREIRYTHEAQQRLYPGDLGFEFVPSLQDWNGIWGRA